MSDRPLRIVVHAPGGLSQSIDLGESEQALIGRSPDWSRVSDGAADGGGGVSVRIESPSVSATHVHLRREGDRIFIADLGSRNGTTLDIASKTGIVLEEPGSDLTIHLARGGDVAAASDVPADARWTSANDYVAGVGEAIGVWLESRDLHARATVVARSETPTDGMGRIPLATGGDLLLEPRGTAGPGWSEALVIIERWLLAQNLRFETEESMRAEGLVVASPAMRRAIARVVSAAASGARVVLITGPSGAGKEGLARCFHRHSGRAGAFVARNCAMFSKELVRSELFGAEKGAFTGSVQRIVGAVEVANEGTLFLDEIGELPQEVQPMLLRFLDHGEYERLGSYARPKQADVRIVAATNHDLRAAVQAGSFRTDLWFRLSVHVVEVPPLRERPEDILAYLRLQKLDTLGPDVTSLLLDHEWAGNFRELVNFVVRTQAAAKDGPITAEVAARLLQEGALSPSRRTPSTSKARPASLSTPPRSSEGTAPENEGREDDPFLAFVERARRAYEEDHEGDAPRTWDQIKNLVENYVKPILFAQLSETADEPNLESVDLRAAAERVRADRGTAVKQLRRYFDRFTKD